MMKTCSVVSQQYSEIGLTQLHRFFEDRVEYWCEIAWRRVDNCQHVADCSLLGLQLITFG